MVIVAKKIPRRNRRKKSPAQIRKLLRKRQRRILDRIANRSGPERDRPMITATNIHYELGKRSSGHCRWRHRRHAAVGSEDGLDPRH